MLSSVTVLSGTNWEASADPPGDQKICGSPQGMGLPGHW